ncbi:hypothetical protein [Streptomyces sp. NPDC005374]|uniref:hypothetical protein n=1 Tax=Streptomyces sp. NPDC005374 TaxID=3364713 RepID=UPI0036CD4F43
MAAVRRALQVALLVGGLFVLGFLCGEKAQAADGLGAPVETITANAEAGAGAGTDLTTGGVLKAVAPHLSTPEVVRPVGDLVGTVTTGLAEAVDIPLPASLPDLAELPALPTLPSFPQTPSWPTPPAVPAVPALPTVPNLPGAPAQTLPARTPIASAPRPGGHAVATPADDEGSAGSGAVYGPRFADRNTVAEAVAHTSAHRTTSSAAAPAPAHRTPSDTPRGALGAKSAVDNGSSRHGDAHAITLDHRAPLRLVPGAAVGVDAAGTRDRHRDIPVFPG